MDAIKRSGCPIYTKNGKRLSSEKTYKKNKIIKEWDWSWIDKNKISRIKKTRKKKWNLNIKKVKSKK